MIRFLQEITDLILPPGVKRNLSSSGKDPSNGFPPPFPSPTLKPDTNFLSSIVERWMEQRPVATPSDWEQLTKRVEALESRMRQRPKPDANVLIFPTKRSGSTS